MADLDAKDIKIIDDKQMLNGTSEADNIDISSYIDMLDVSYDVIHINSGEGNDEVKGSLLNNIINTGSGDDIVFSGHSFGAQKIDGGDGNDKLVFDFSIGHITSYSNKNGVITITALLSDVIQFSNFETINVTGLPDGVTTGTTLEDSTVDLTLAEFDALLTSRQLLSNEVYFVEVDADDLLFGSHADIDFATLLGTNVPDNGAASSTIGTGKATDTLFAGPQNNLLGIDMPYVIAVSTIPDYSDRLIINGEYIAAQAYDGPVAFLNYQYIGGSTNETAAGTESNDFFNLGEGNDAADGGLGDDVLDGGTGSNFLTGGGGADTFYLDGRSGSITWSTITDFNADQANIWGWVEGISKLISSEASAGAEGYKGATLHYDLNNDGTIDTSITFSGLSLSDIPEGAANVVEENGYLLFA